MKKNLLLLFVLVFFSSNAQNVFWEERSTGFLTTASNMTTISYADANTVWVYATAGDGSGDYYQQWGRSLDGGNTWTNGPIDLGNVDLVIGDICAISPTTAFVCAWANAAGLTGGVFKTTDSGATWQKQQSASYNTIPDSFPNIVQFWDENKGVTMGDPAQGYFEIYTTLDGGANWTRVPEANIPAPLAGEYGYTNNYEKAGNVLWFMTNKGRIYKTTDFGLTWTATQTPISDFQNGNLSYRDENNGLLTTDTFEFYRTTDGSTWVQEVPTGYYRSFEICYVPGTVDMYVTTGEDPDGIGRGSSYSLDGGLNWIDINNFDVTVNDGANSLSFFDITNGLSGGFTTDSVTGGIWKWIATPDVFAAPSFSSDRAFTATPNPTSGVFRIGGVDITNVEIFDILGKKVGSSTHNGLNSVEMNISSLNAGLYMVNVTNALGNSSTIKVVKQ